MRRFDRNRDLRRRRCSLRDYPVTQLREPGAVMGHGALRRCALPALSSRQARCVSLRPIKADKEMNMFTHELDLPLLRATATLVDPCTGARGANLLSDVGRGRFAGARVLRRCSRHRGAKVAPGKSARAASLQRKLAVARSQGYRVGKGAKPERNSTRKNGAAPCPRVAGSARWSVDAWARRCTGRGARVERWSRAFAHPT